MFYFICSRAGQATFPGLPGVVIGRNKYIQWGVTNTGVDVQDLYVLNATQTHYMYDGESHPFDLITEVITVKGAQTPTTLTLRSTRHHGIVVSDCRELVGGAIARSGAVLALRWSTTDARLPDTTFSAFYGLQRAANWGEFRAALRFWTSPSQNVVFAGPATDSSSSRSGSHSRSSGAGSGNGSAPAAAFGYQMPGYVPRRNLTLNHSGAWPAPGDSSAYAWRDAPWPYDALPRTLNPVGRDFIATANNAPIPRAWPYFLSADWDSGGEGFRAARITQLVVERDGAGTASGSSSGSRAGHSVESISRVQLDTLSLFALNVTAGLYGSWRAGALQVGTAAGGALVQRLGGPGGWGGGMALGSEEATLWAELWQRLSTLGAAEGHSGEGSASAEGGGAGADAAAAAAAAFWEDPMFLLNALASDGSARGSDPACNAAGFPTCAAFAAAQVDGVARHFSLGEDGRASPGGPSIPLWGVDTHSVLMEHEILHGTVLECLGDRHVGHGGDAFTVNVGGWALSDSDHVQTHGPSVRHVMQGSEEEEEEEEGGGAPGGSGRPATSSRWVMPLGQEGDLLAAGYDDLMGAWARGEYLDMAWVPPSDGMKETIALNP